MQGKNRFTSIEAQKIKGLLRAKNRADRSEQKMIRRKLREIGFYITDFDNSQAGFTENDFENLIKTGLIKIITGNTGSFSSNVEPPVPSHNVDSKAQQTRQQYKPRKVEVLFVGESPPAGGTFFYYANSNLFKCIHLAFSQVYNNRMGNRLKFLQSFSNLNCYLDDLCLKPINNLTDDERLTLRKNGIIPLGKRLEKMKPRAVIIVMRSIESEVLEAIQRAQLSSVVVKTTTFPAFSGKNKTRCFSDAVDVINELIKVGILPKLVRS